VQHTHSEEAFSQASQVPDKFHILSEIQGGAGRRQVSFFSPGEEIRDAVRTVIRLRRGLTHPFRAASGVQKGGDRCSCDAAGIDGSWRMEFVGGFSYPGKER